MATEKKTTAPKAATKKATAKKTVAKKAAKAVVKHIGLVKNDPYLADYEDAIKGRHEHALWKLGHTRLALPSERGSAPGSTRRTLACTFSVLCSAPSMRCSTDSRSRTVSEKRAAFIST